METEPIGKPEGRPRWWRPIAIATTVVFAIAAVAILKDYASTIPRSSQQWAVKGFLEGLLVLHGVVLVAAPLGTAILLWPVIRARRSRRRRPIMARGLLLAVSCLIGLAFVEISAAAWRAWTHRIPTLPEAFQKLGAQELPNLPVDFQDPASRARKELEIVVVGESSARGEPYGDPFPPLEIWLSIGQIIAWQLERAIPGQQVHVTINAFGGETLATQHNRLSDLERRPDVMIIYSGHNEFHARFGWERIVSQDDSQRDPLNHDQVEWRRDLSTPLARMIREALARNGVEVAPPPKVTRQFVDWPVCTADERAEVIADFERRLNAIVDYCDRLKALPILVIPPGNDAGFEPNRSIAVGRLTQPRIDAIAREFQAAKQVEESDPARALTLYRQFLSQQPKFAEAHYRVARLLEKSKEFEEANREYILARDLDNYPQRCPSDLQDTYRAVARRHPRAILIDGQAVLSALSPHGILDDNLFHDGQHPVLLAHVALAQAALKAVHDRQALGWPAGTPAPKIDAADCAENFKMSPNRWASLCDWVAYYYKRTAYLRHDPTHRLAIAEHYEKAASAIRAGTAPEDTGVPGLGTRPTW